MIRKLSEHAGFLMIDKYKNYICIDGYEQDCSNSSLLAMELLQSCTKPSI